MIKPHGLFDVWSPDQVAECLEGVDDDLYHALWDMVRHYDKLPRSECNDDFAERAVKNFWGELSEEHQLKLNELATKHEEEWEKMKQNYAAAERMSEPYRK